jgi:D-aminopeptidase
MASIQRMFLFCMALSISSFCVVTGSEPRGRDLGVLFQGTPGPLNAITDVTGIEVGHGTLISGEGKLEAGKGPVRTGLTAILPRGKANSAQGDSLCLS